MFIQVGDYLRDAVFESVASTELYSSPPHIEVPGALAAYDLPDLMAATLHRSAQTMKMQLWNPTDTNGKQQHSCWVERYDGSRAQSVGATVSKNTRMIGTNSALMSRPTNT